MTAYPATMQREARDELAQVWATQLVLSMHSHLALIADGTNRRRIVEARAAIEAEAVAPFAEFIVTEFPAGTGDWACAECRPDSDMTTPDFRCIPHKAHALLAKP